MIITLNFVVIPSVEKPHKILMLSTDVNQVKKKNTKNISGQNVTALLKQKTIVYNVIRPFIPY